jgi:hypothetical protein
MTVTPTKLNSLSSILILILEAPHLERRLITNNKHSTSNKSKYFNPKLLHFKSLKI